MIETRAELDRYVELMENLDRQAESRKLSPEEVALLTLLERLVKDFDDQIDLPSMPPHKMIAYLMQWRGLRQADLLGIFGSRAVTSDVLTGKREPTKAQIRKLSEFFHVSAELFL